MRKLFGILIALITTSAYSTTAEWNISEVTRYDNKVVGYIYHSSAVGTRIGTTTERSVTGLRLVCSAKEYIDSPIVVLFWNGMFGNKPKSVEVKVDGKSINADYTWQQENQILYRQVGESTTLIEGLKEGRSITFRWADEDNRKMATTFDLSTFDKNYEKFKSMCSGRL